MGFEKYISYRAGERGSLSIGISNLGLLTINHTLMATYFTPQGFEYCFLYFDKEKQLIGIQPCHKEKGTYKISKHRTGYGQFHVAALLKLYRVMSKDGRRFVPTWDEENKMLVIDLNNPVPARGEE